MQTENLNKNRYQDILPCNVDISIVELQRIWGCWLLIFYWNSLICSRSQSRTVDDEINSRPTCIGLHQCILHRGKWQ